LDAVELRQINIGILNRPTSISTSST